MKIEGLQKLTLLDYPEKVACTIFTAGCNFRCPFCHNASLVIGDRGNIIPIETQKNGEYTEKEILEFLKKRQGILDGVCVTGGEPLLQPDLEEFIGKIKELGYLVKLDTNGSFPDKLKKLVNDKRIDYVAMDIKNCLLKYGETIGVSNYDTRPVEESAAFLMEGRIPYEFRTTVTRELHTEEDIYRIRDWISADSSYYLQQFVDSGDIIRSGLHSCDEETMRKWVTILQEKIPGTKLRGVD